MFRHQGKSRTLKHNLRIATLLSFVAGIVNVTGFIAFSQLTTNVTGHFALLMNDVSNFEIWSGAIYFLYILSFLLGSFCSSLLIEIFRANQKMNVSYFDRGFNSNFHSFPLRFLAKCLPQHCSLHLAFCHGTSKLFRYQNI